MKNNLSNAYGLLRSAQISTNQSAKPLITDETKFNANTIQIPKILLATMAATQADAKLEAQAKRTI